MFKKRKNIEPKYPNNKEAERCSKIVEWGLPGNIMFFTEDYNPKKHGHVKPQK